MPRLGPQGGWETQESSLLNAAGGGTGMWKCQQHTDLLVTSYMWGMTTILSQSASMAEDLWHKAAQWNWSALPSSTGVVVKLNTYPCIWCPWCSGDLVTFSLASFLLLLTTQFFFLYWRLNSGSLHLDTSSSHLFIHLNFETEFQ